MSIVRPFRALRPVPGKAALVAAPPYDVLNSEEARVMAKGNPISFLHVSKPEIDFDRSVDVYSDAIYQKGRENLDGLVKSGVLVRDTKPNFFLYEQRMKVGDKMHVQVGLTAGVSCEEYQQGIIKKHELTRADKEADRTKHVDVTNGNTGPVFLTYRAVPEIDRFVEKRIREKPVYDFVAQDGIGHRVWVVDNEDDIAFLVKAFAKIPCLYIADGHHRAASGNSVQKARKAANPKHTGEEGYNFFMAVIFPHDRMNIMDYNRIVVDLKGQSEAEFMAKVKEKFDVAPTDKAKPERALEFGMYLSKKWYRLTAEKGTFAENDPVESLDVSILQNNLLAPILGIEDPPYRFRGRHPRHEGARKARGRGRRSGVLHVPHLHCAAHGHRGRRRNHAS
jgi:uncharacterized protein (DUF1015 family)